MKRLYLLVVIFSISVVYDVYAPESNTTASPDEFIKSKVDEIHPLALRINDLPIQEQVTNVIGYYDGVSEEDVLWLARAAMSETKDLNEGYHVMWVIRNRVETNYRGRDTYKGVVLDPFQFSTFNKSTNKTLARRRLFYMNRGFDADDYGNWHTFLKMASIVLTRHEIWNPHEQTVRHFVHQDALKRIPKWLKDEPDVQINSLSIYEGI